MPSAATCLITSTYKLDRKGLAGNKVIRTLTPRRTTKGLIPSTRRQQTRIQIGHGQAQVWPSDHAQAKLGRCIATEHAHGSVAT
ncbi:hypothetical protein DY000_02016949 [Brassica cretica]|uniref:Uncharacterized protein n=1 Tax=Brassica cretica TaxID=69181 RepID=A0ABQ7D5M3_BRACR|nr:hypothetical protein DY000_02016949 [Brassica cretica]